MDSEHCQLLASVPQTSSPKPISSQRKLCLETSFTSLQSPSVENNSSSLNSSITNGYHSSKSQTSPIQLTSIITLLDEKLKARQHSERRNLSLNLQITRDKKIDLIYDDWFGLAPLASPESLSEVSSISSRASFAFHLEKSNLTEVLSSSYELKTPKVLRRTPKIPGNLSTCADDIKSVRYFQKLGQNSKVFRSSSQNGSSYTTSSGDLSYESATSVSLSRCCSKDDHDNFAGNSSRYCGIQEESLIAEVHVQEAQNSNSIDSDSFQSAENTLDCELTTNGKLCSKEEPQLVVLELKPHKTVYMETHFDEDIFRHVDTPTNREERPILRSPGTPMDIKGYLPTFPTTGGKVSTSPQILSPSTPQEIDPDLMANFAMDLNLEEENRSMHFANPTLVRQEEIPAKANSVDSGSICRTPSESKNVTFNPQVINIDPKFISRTSPASSEDSPNRSSSWLSRKTEKWHLLPSRGTKKSNSAKKSEDIVSPCLKRRDDDEICFSKNESLPLLSGLTSANSEKMSPNFVRRKKYVYPITSVGKGESSV